MNEEEAAAKRQALCKKHIWCLHCMTVCCNWLECKDCHKLIRIEDVPNGDTPGST